MAAPDASNVRQAALLLHGLAPAVRERVLAKLSAQEQLRLRPLLKELTTLGVAPALGQKVLGPTQPPIEARPKTAQERLNQMHPDQVAHRLRNCAPVTIAQVLLMNEWAWKEQLLVRIPELRRAEVSRYVRAGLLPLAPAARDVVCEQLCRRSVTSQTTEARGAKRKDNANERPQSVPAERRRVGIRRWVRWMR